MSKVLTDEQVISPYWKEYEKHFLSNVIFRYNFDGYDFWKDPMLTKAMVMPLEINTQMMQWRWGVISENLGTKFNSIIEIGSGFGNQCKVIKEDIETNYTIVDTLAMTAISSMYLNSYEIKHNKTVANDILFLLEHEYDLFISCSTLSYVPREYLEIVLTKILPNCKDFFIIDEDIDRIISKNLPATRKEIKYKKPEKLWLSRGK